MTTAIEVAGLTKQYRGTPVLRGVDLTAEQGEIVALLGSNGAGKTTTISILTTLTRADSGTAVVAGCDVRRDPGGVRQRISLTGQSAAVDDALTGVENLVMLSRLSGLSPRAARRRADELLGQFALTDAAGRKVKTYSGGMRRRLDLALSFVVTPQVLFLDEPTTGVDPRSRLDLWEVIRGLADAGTTVFLTTQYLEEADQLADRIAVLHEGLIVRTGTAPALKAQFGSDVLVAEDADGSPLAEIATDGSIDGIRRALDELEAAHPAARVQLRRPTLDDVFLTLTATGDADRTTIREFA
ncbi:ATP-binding cassette domain-containing protein [Microbacterium sp. Au-Mic1]|uniref:ATP-binding cassette domain-containing protein n=1 Tax=Microbacterium sp. Au-Mic1 TaxID=2906457 RepID=UPI001E3EB812|nr:ATP-binding cassette domain-containing protein [Microbacterium sp. Au-Mic1]MCE4025326.1 ATP-binding cassette domain-containing protein [Microbacterium sp. Au-Mic1]